MQLRVVPGKANSIDLKDLLVQEVWFDPVGVPDSESAVLSYLRVPEISLSTIN